RRAGHSYSVDARGRRNLGRAQGSFTTTACGNRDLKSSTSVVAGLGRCTLFASRSRDCKSSAGGLDMSRTDGLSRLVVIRLMLRRTETSQFRFFAALVILMMIASPCLWSQGSVTIFGSVTDTAGALVPGVIIKVTNTQTGAIRNAVSGPTGDYVVV